MLDYDNDGWLDVYLVNGSTVPAFDGKEPAPLCFFRTNTMTFTDLTDKAGVANERWGSGVAGDIYVSNFGKNRLYHNNHDGTFTDVAEKAGVVLGGWSTGPTWGDYDHDGWLYLFVSGYVKFDPNQPRCLGRTVSVPSPASLAV